jgi:hypothetical protein
MQDHDHGPEPDTAEAEPAEHKPDEGMEAKAAPLLEPHAPLMMTLAEQPTVVPPLEPTQVQYQGPEPVTAETEPAVQRLVVGAE